MRHPLLLAGRVLVLLVALLAGPAPGAAASGRDVHPPADPDPATVAWLVQPSGELGGADVRTYLSHELLPGQSVSDSIALTNHSTTDLTLRIYPTDAYSDPVAGNFSLLAADEAPRDVGTWVRLPATEITIPARARAEVPVVVQVPADAEPGDHAGGIVTSYASPAFDAEGDPVVVDARIAMRVYVQIPGERRPAVTIEDISSDFAMGPHQLTGTLRTVYTVRNVGNTRVGFEDEVARGGPFGAGLGAPTRSTVPELLPGAAVRREVVAEHVPAVFALTSRVEVTPVDLGAASTEARPVSAHVTTWAIPWAVVSVVAVVGLTGVTVRWRRRRARGSRSA